MRGLLSISSHSRNDFNKFKNTGARRLYLSDGFEIFLEISILA